MEKKIVSVNRKAFHNYNIIEVFEGGLVLKGYEVKSLRAGQVNISDGFIRINKGEVLLENVHITPYKQQSTHILNYNPLRTRKILLHKKQIQKLTDKVKERGFTLIPIELYFSPRGYAKVSIALAKGKHFFDKRESIQKREMEIEMQRALKENKR